MPRWTFHQLDVFTTRPLAGNALAVFPDARGLDAGTMQGLAREMNLSETAFVFPSSRATRHIRFFTPTSEVPLVGHPTVGTWWALADLGLLTDLPPDGTTTITQETGRGVLPVDITMVGGRPTRVVMTQTVPLFGDTVDRAALALAVGGPDALTAHPLSQVVSTALPQVMAPVVTRAALTGLPSGGTGAGLAQLLRSHDSDCVMLFAPPEGGTVFCRMFAPGFNIPEDAATGSAAGALGAYLVHHGVVQPVGGRAKLTLHQGAEIGRPSTLYVEVPVAADGTIGQVRVGGEAVRIITGEVTL